MSRALNQERVLDEFSTTLDFPISYVVHSRDTHPFVISIFHERWIKGEKLNRDNNSDVPFATWLPEGGLSQINSAPFVTLRDAGLLREVEAFCNQTYEAWKDAEWT
jgi:hypothetical protein